MNRLGDIINQPSIDAWRAANGVQEGDPAAPGTNLKAGDHVLVAGFLPLVVYGPAPESPGCFAGGYEPVFGERPLPWLVKDITHRCGPNNEQMPIYDELKVT